MWDHMCVKCVNIRLHQNSDAQVGTGLAEPESEKIFPSCVWSWQWSGLFCAPSVAVCCYLGLMMWFVISKESSRNWDQAATLWNKTFTVQESCRRNLEGSFLIQIVCIRLHFSLSFFSFSHFTFLVYLDMSENCENPHGNRESPACPGKGRRCQEVSRCSWLQCMLVGWEWATVLRLLWWHWSQWWNWDSCYQRAGDCTSDEVCCEVLWGILCDIRSTAGLSCSTRILYAYTNFRDTGEELWQLICFCLLEISEGDKPVGSLLT